ncbi:uncharacterized protein LOC142100257 [Mixophyes fleayi]|uniref:uncharacterized protein LOC142100257 n=1 Tax=Mixophyes fleayi TaxID=3061075 RepID=UPI003F4E2566
MESGGVKQKLSEENKKMEGRKRSRKGQKKETAEPKKKRTSPEDDHEKKRKREESKAEELDDDQPRPGTEGKAVSSCPEDDHGKKRKREESKAEELDGDQPIPVTWDVSHDRCCPMCTERSLHSSCSCNKVLLASEPVTKTEVAIKILRKRAMTSAEEEKALVEKKVLEEACGSPFLLRGYRTFRTKDALCFVMEYACGGDLEQLLDRRGRLDISTATFYAAEMVSGLQHLHLKGFIHRDLKPENILIDGAGHIKIADFGLAVNKTEGATGYAGTRGYIAPEMLLGQTYNTGVDWFSFGVVLFQMTTGESQFFCELSALPGFNLSLTTRDIIEEVLLASEPVTKTEVAIKILRKRAMTSAEEEKALVEKKVLEEACGSPFLLRGYRTFRTKDALCFVMEYACGGDLEQLLDRRGRLDISTATFYAAEMVSGLQHLHLKGFIHRDLKPENILIDGAGHIKIADFGLAVNKTEGATGYAGTLGYIAPEMLLGHTYNTGVDWFSFGVVLFQMTTGESPFVCQLSALPGFNLSLTTSDIIEELLCNDPQKRLGLNGLIRQHPFFRGIDWEELEALRVQPPYIPGKFLTYALIPFISHFMYMYVGEDVS